MRKKIAGIDTNTLLLAGAGAVAVYMLTRPKTTVYPTTYPTTALQYQQSIAAQQGNSTSSIIAAGGSALGSILNAISNF